MSNIVIGCLNISLTLSPRLYLQMCWMRMQSSLAIENLDLVPFIHSHTRLPKISSCRSNRISTISYSHEICTQRITALLVSSMAIQQSVVEISPNIGRRDSDGSRDGSHSIETGRSMDEWIQPLDHAHATSQSRLQVPIQSNLCTRDHPLCDEVHLQTRAGDTYQVDHRCSCQERAKQY